MTEQEYVFRLTFLSEWEPDQRAQFVSMMQELERTPMNYPIEIQIGVINLTDGAPFLHTGDRATFIAMNVANIAPEVRSELEINMPGALPVLVIAPPTQIAIHVPVFCVPISQQAEGPAN